MGLECSKPHKIFSLTTSMFWKAHCCHEKIRLPEGLSMEVHTEAYSKAHCACCRVVLISPNPEESPGPSHFVLKQYGSVYYDNNLMGILMDVLFSFQSPGLAVVIQPYQWPCFCLPQTSAVGVNHATKKCSETFLKDRIFYTTKHSDCIKVLYTFVLLVFYNIQIFISISNLCIVHI